MKLTFAAYWHAIGSDNAALVATAAGVKAKYAQQIKLALKTPGKDTALALIDAARKLTPGWEPDLELMLRQERREPTRRRKIEPSAAFLRSAAKKKLTPAKKAK